MRNGIPDVFVKMFLMPIAKIKEPHAENGFFLILIYAVISRAIKISDCAKMTINMIKRKKQPQLNSVPE